MIRRGEYGEILARGYLEEQGVHVLETNYRFHHGEIDIIAEEGEVLVFCEVKTRTNDRYGAPEHAVTPLKQRQIRKIARLSHRAPHPRPAVPVRCRRHPCGRTACAIHHAARCLQVTLAVFEAFSPILA